MADPGRFRKAKPKKEQDFEDEFRHLLIGDRPSLPCPPDLFQEAYAFVESMLFHNYGKFVTDAQKAGLANIPADYNAMMANTEWKTRFYSWAAGAAQVLPEVEFLQAVTIFERDPTWEFAGQIIGKYLGDRAATPVNVDDAITKPILAAYKRYAT